MGVSLEGLFRREVTPALLERNAFDKIKDEIGKTVTAFAHPFGNLVKLGSIMVFDTASESVSQKLFGQATDEGLLSAMDYESLEFESSGKGFSSRQLPCGIDWIAIQWYEQFIAERRASAGADYILDLEQGIGGFPVNRAVRTRHRRETQVQ